MCTEPTSHTTSIVAATPPADAVAEPVKPDARRLARVACRRLHEADLCTQKRKVADEGGAVNTAAGRVCKEAVRVSRVMGAVAWRARALQGCGRAGGRAHRWYQPTVDEDVDVESRIRDRGWSRDRKPRPVRVWRMGPRRLHARCRLCQSRRGSGVELGRASGAENSIQNGVHALATVVMHNEAKGVGKQLRTTLHRSAHVCAQGRFGERRDARSHAHSSTCGRCAGCCRSRARTAWPVGPKFLSRFGRKL